jgi:flagellin-specific chaperone FliS
MATRFQYVSFGDNRDRDPGISQTCGIIYGNEIQLDKVGDSYRIATCVNPLLRYFSAELENLPYFTYSTGRSVTYIVCKLQTRCEQLPPSRPISGMYDPILYETAEELRNRIRMIRTTDNELEDQIETLKEEVRVLKSNDEVSRLNNDIRGRDSQILALKDQINDLINAQGSTGSTTQVDELKSKIRRQKFMIQTLEEQWEGVSKNNEELKAQITTLEKIQEIRDQPGTSGSSNATAIADLLEQIREKDATIAAREQQIQILGEKVKTLYDQYISASSATDVVTLQEQIKAKDAIITDLQAQLNAYSASSVPTPILLPFFQANEAIRNLRIRVQNDKTYTIDCTIPRGYYPQLHAISAKRDGDQWAILANSRRGLPLTLTEIPYSKPINVPQMLQIVANNVGQPVPSISAIEIILN